MAHHQSRYRTIGDIPATFPVFPLPGALLLPRTQLPLNIFEPRYLQMVDFALAGDRVIGMIQPEAQADSASDKPPLYSIGCLGRLTSFSETDDGRYMIVLTGICRFRLVDELAENTSFRQINADFSDFAGDIDEEEAKKAEIDRDAVLKVFHDYLETYEMKADWQEVAATGNELLINTLAMLSPYEVREKQALLEAMTVAQRAEILIALTERKLAMEKDTQGSRLQ